MLLTGLILTTVLFAAHMLRFYGMGPAFLVFSLLLTLTYRKPLMRKIWLFLQAVYLAAWIWVSADLVMLRLINQQPWIRISIIMIVVILVNILTGLMLLGRKGRDYFGK